MSPAPEPEVDIEEPKTKEVEDEPAVVDSAVPEEPAVVKSVPPKAAPTPAPATDNSSGAPHTALLLVLVACGIVGVTELGVIASQTKSSTAAAPTIIIGDSTAAAAAVSEDYVSGNDLVPDTIQSLTTGENTCAGANPNLPNQECIINAMVNVGPQAGANITKGFVGELDVGDLMPITEPYWKAGLCPVNVHWHLGAEHYSVGEFDENGKGIREIDTSTAGGQNTFGSFQCHHFDESNPIFTREYDWKHCVGMEVGQTYEVHWPHSAAGACGTPNQYQTPFYDGVFCNLDMETFETLTPQQIAMSVGVQGQVFTIVNDEAYFRPNLMRGMIVDGEMGQDIAIYTGSSTGSSRNNEVCSAYSPVTWQVDRKCHLISASSFDMMCAEMKMQRDDMTYDLVAHGSRPLVDPKLTADNQQTRKLSGEN